MATANEIEIRVTVDDKTKAPFQKIENKLKQSGAKAGTQGGQQAGKSFTDAFAKATSKDWFNAKASNPFGQFSKAAEFQAGAAAARAKLAFEKGMADIGKGDARFGLVGKGGLFAGMFDGMKDAASSAFSAIGSGASQLGGMLGKVGGPLVTITALLGGVGAIAGPAVVGIGAIAAAVGGTLATALVGGIGALGLFNVKAREAFTGLGEHIQNSLARLTDQSGLTATFQKIAGTLKTTFLNLRTEIKDMMITVQPMLEQMAAGVANLFNTLVPRMQTALAGMGPVIEGFAQMLGDLGVGLGDMFIKLSEHAQGFGETFNGLGEVFRQVLPALGEFMGVIADRMGPALQTLAPLLADFVEKLGPLLGAAIAQVTPMLPALFDGFNQIMAALIPLIPPLTEMAVALLPPLATAIQAAGMVITTYLVPAAQALGPVINAAMQAIIVFIGTLKAAAQAASGDWAGAMATMQEVTAGTFMQVTETSNAGFEAMRAAGQRGMTGMQNSVQSGMQNSASAVLTNVNQMVGHITGAQGRFQAGGSALANSFRNGWVAAANAAVQAVRNTVAQIASLLPGSPAKEGPFSGKGYTKLRGQRMVSDFAHGIKKNAKQVRLTAADAMGNMAFSVFGSKDKRGRRGPLATGSISTGIGAYKGAGAPSPSMLRDNYKRQNKAAFYGLANGSAQVHVSGDADGAVATMISKLIRTGKLRVSN